MLAVTHNVKLLFHVAVAEGGLGEGATVNPAKLKDFVRRVLACVDRENNRFWRKFRKDNIDSIIFPMIGAGEEGVSVEVSGNEIIPAAIDYLGTTPNTTIKEIYFSAFKLRDKSACDAVLSKYCEKNHIMPLQE
jgi:O-acetyl-ADP-ribose deacetylase (regulator of RNase III)